MKVGQLIKVLEQLDPNYDIFYVQNSGIVAPIKSIQECSYRGFQPETFAGICCGNKVENIDIKSSPIYISTARK